MIIFWGLLWIIYDLKKSHYLIRNLELISYIMNTSMNSENMSIWCLGILITFNNRLASAGFNALLYFDVPGSGRIGFEPRYDFYLNTATRSLALPSLPPVPLLLAKCWPNVEMQTSFPGRTREVTRSKTTTTTKNAIPQVGPLRYRRTTIIK